MAKKKKCWASLRITPSICFQLSRKIWSKNAKVARKIGLQTGQIIEQAYMKNPIFFCGKPTKTLLGGLFYILGIDNNAWKSREKIQETINVSSISIVTNFRAWITTFPTLFPNFRIKNIRWRKKQRKMLIYKDKLITNKCIRVEEAKELREQGLKPNEIATKMGLATRTVYYYLWPTGKEQTREDFCSMIRTELTSFNLPLEWESETFTMLQDYLKIRGSIGRHFVRDIQSILHLLCRRYKMPTPRELSLATYQSHDSRKKVSGYLDVLQILDGVVLAKPIDYIKKFVDAKKLPKEENEEAETLLKKIPLMYLQSRNPRGLAATILYVMHRTDNPTNKRVWTCRYLAEYFKITEVAIRRNSRQFFRNK